MSDTEPLQQIDFNVMQYRSVRDESLKEVKVHAFCLAAVGVNYGSRCWGLNIGIAVPCRDERQWEELMEDFWRNDSSEDVILSSDDGFRIPVAISQGNGYEETYDVPGSEPGSGVLFGYLSPQHFFGPPRLKPREGGHPPGEAE